MKTARLFLSALTLCGAVTAPITLAAALDWKSVTTERLLNAENDDNSWLIYGRNYNSTRYSPLDLINTSNIKKMKVAYAYSLGTLEGQQVTPSVNDGIMIVAISQQYVDALDAKTGNRLWRYELKLPSDAVQFACCGSVTKGVALYKDKVFVAALDARVLALDAKTGTLVWEKTLADYKSGYTFTMAPLVVKDKVMVGFAGGEFGIRGQILALDTETGNEAWKASTLPDPGSPAAETWGKDSLQYGGGAAWNTASYDPDLNLVYWGTGNPAPWNSEMRPGDNLYTNSMLALDADTGERKWYFQFVPHDSWDWDAMNEPVLVDVEIDGKPVKGLLQANKDGHLYLLDRTNGKFIHSLPFVNVTWGTVDQQTGKMNVLPDKRPGIGKTAEVCPSFFGGKGWAAIAYNPKSHIAFIPSIEMCVKLTHEETSYKKGTMYLGAEGVMVAPGKGHMAAVDVEKNKMLWKWDHESPLQSGSALATAGGIVFVGTFEGDFVALDQATGKELWKFRTSSAIIGGPITYTVDGKQYVAIASGYGGAFPLWAGKGVPENIKRVNKGGTLFVFELGE
jgi:alcohol dehydrogenase (cytochrome c)